MQTILILLVYSSFIDTCSLQVNPRKGVKGPQQAFNTPNQKCPIFSEPKTHLFHFQTLSLIPKIFQLWVTHDFISWEV